MKRLLFCGVLLLTNFSLAQQTGHPPSSTPPPYQTQPRFPNDSENPGKQFPPDTRAPAPETLSSAQVQQHIMEHLDSEPRLANTNVKASVDDSAVVLTGHVSTEVQHELALRIAQSHAGQRSIVDKIRIQQQV
jgi:hypothetical protein